MSISSEIRIGDDVNNLILLVLTVSNCIYVWSEEKAQYVRCVYLQTRHLSANKIIVKGNNMLILAEGYVYTGKITTQVIRNPIDCSEYKETYNNKKEISTTSRLRIDLKRITNADRVLDIFVDDDFQSFAVLQENSRNYFKIPDPPQEYNTFKALLHEVSKADAVHDIVFHVDSEEYPAHRFIVCSRSKGIMRLIADCKHRHVDLNVQGLTGKMFDLILKFIYSNYLPETEDMDTIFESIGPYFKGDRWDAANLFLDIALKFEIQDLATGIKSLIAGMPIVKPKFPKLRRTALSHLYDVKIVCAEDKELYAHKCVLVARLEYFSMMFGSSWSETECVNFSCVPIEYMQPLLDFLYTEDTAAFRREKYSESFLYNMMVICDQYFVTKLRELCERLALERISIRKCGEMLQFACSYNCKILEKGCLQYICQNLARVLEHRSLESCDPNVLSRINLFYRLIYKHKLDYRFITPDSQAVSDENLEQYIADFSVRLDYKIDDDFKPRLKNKAKPNKSAFSKQYYEKEAIRSMKERTDENSTIQERNVRKSELNASETEISQTSKTGKWLKVNESAKECKNKFLLAAVRTNDILKEELESKESVCSILSQSFYIPQTHHESAMRIRPSLNFGDFTPLITGKISQKQRKKLNTELVDNSITSIPVLAKSWKNVSSSLSNTFADIIKSPQNVSNINFPSSEKLTMSFKNGTPGKSLNFSTSSQSFTSATDPLPAIISNRETNSFTKILQDERKQKELYDKMRSKSLVLTQVEESAIAELETFYNVDNVHDEIIQVKRKHQQVALNFAVWQRKNIES